MPTRRWIRHSFSPEHQPDGEAQPRDYETSPGSGTERELSAHNYRAYVIGLDGHVAMRIDLSCQSDGDARERTRELVDGHAVELWDGARMIQRFEPRTFMANGGCRTG
jgi:hypothetical protein